MSSAASPSGSSPSLRYTWDELSADDALVRQLRDSVYFDVDARATGGRGRSAGASGPGGSARAVATCFMPWKIRQMLGDFMCAHQDSSHDAFRPVPGGFDAPSTKLFATERFKDAAGYLQRHYGGSNEDRLAMGDWLRQCKNGKIDVAYVDVASRFERERELVLGALSARRERDVARAEGANEPPHPAGTETAARAEAPVSTEGRTDDERPTPVREGEPRATDERADALDPAASVSADRHAVAAAAGDADRGADESPSRRDESAIDRDARRAGMNRRSMVVRSVEATGTHAAMVTEDPSQIEAAALLPGEGGPISDDVTAVESIEPPAPSLDSLFGLDGGGGGGRLVSPSPSRGSRIFTRGETDLAPPPFDPSTRRASPPPTPRASRVRVPASTVRDALYTSESRAYAAGNGVPSITEAYGLPCQQRASVWRAEFDAVSLEVAMLGAAYEHDAMAGGPPRSTMDFVRRAGDSRGGLAVGGVKRPFARDEHPLEPRGGYDESDDDDEPRVGAVGPDGRIAGVDKRARWSGDTADDDDEDGGGGLSSRGARNGIFADERADASNAPSLESLVSGASSHRAESPRPSREIIVDG